MVIIKTGALKRGVDLRRRTHMFGNYQNTMTKMLRLLVPIALLTTAPFAYADCSDAESAADDAYTYAHRALTETNFDDAQNYMRRARNAADDAKSAAEDCGCEDAESYSDDAYTYARRGYNASNLRELWGYAKRAMQAAEEAKDATGSCR